MSSGAGLATRETATALALSLEAAQRMAGHSNAKTTGLYDRRNDDSSVGEVERIGV
jgi:hypothetical protein